MMEPLAGQKLHIHPLNTLRRRADLIYFEGPLLSLYENASGEPFFALWADVSDDSHRWLVFRATSEAVSAYVGRTKSLRDILLSAGDGYVFVVDAAEPEDFGAVVAVRTEDLPVAYLPAIDSFYEFEPSHEAVDLVAMAQHYKSALLDVHLVKGRGIRFGTADAVTLGAVLKSAGDLSEAVAISLYSRAGANDQENREEARAYGQFEFLTHKAASFSAILRPMLRQGNLPGFADRTGEVIRVVQSLLRRTPLPDNLRPALEGHDDAVVKKLEAFAKEVSQRGISLDLRWIANADSQVQAATVDQASAGRILENINRLENEESTGLWTHGVFLAVDTKARSYRFANIAGRESTGHFDSRLAYPVTSISFRSQYRIYLNRKVKHVSGRSKPKVEETIGEIEPFNELTLDSPYAT